MNTRSVDDHDSPWKEALEQRFPEFLALLFPDVYEQVDWSQGREFLDKEAPAGCSGCRAGATLCR
ncbi:hypothetical protein AB8616_21535 [Marinomonas sp. RS-M-Aa-14]|uniref:hypothetical protein n=1 Tax=Marinomonas sp. RS-M-Aa-14 TaxID=3241169 RepID=UPI003AAC1E20